MSDITALGEMSRLGSLISATQTASPITGGTPLTTTGVPTVPVSTTKRPSDKSDEMLKRRENVAEKIHGEVSSSQAGETQPNPSATDS